MEERREERRPGVRWDRWSSWLVGAGILARVAQYLSGRSLWLDEAMLSETILRPLATLFAPPEHGQVAPAGFLLLEKAATGLFGTGELALRLPPLLAGIASLFLFRRVGFRLFPAATARLALALFAFGDPLVYYASELKPYALDVAVALFLLDRGLDALEEPRRRGALPALAVSGAAAVWLSNPSVFVLAGVGAALALSAVGRVSRLVPVGAVFAAWLASFAVLWIGSLRTISSQGWLLRYWEGTFLPFPPRSSEDVAWVPRAIVALLQDPGGIVVRGAGLFAGLVGVWYLARRRPRTLLLLGGPFVATLAASALRRYPFSGRLILFLAPFLLLILADGAERVREATAATARASGTLLVALLVLPPAGLCAYRIVRPRVREEMKPVLAYLAAHRRPADRLYVFGYAVTAFDYYARRYGLEPRDAARSVWGAEPAAAAADLDALRGTPRAWILFSHTLSRTGDDAEDAVVAMLDARGKRRAAFHAPGSGVYLYDFGEQPVRDGKEN